MESSQSTSHTPSPYHHDPSAEKRRGRLIVIEGTDGSGKKTQAAFLTKRLKCEGYKTATLAFPQYGKKSAGLVEEYLNGKYGTPEDVNPYACSLFYALDRYDVAPKIKKLIAQGCIVIIDRYVDSNAGHQGGKIANFKEREKFLSWLYDMEYRILEIPKPDRVIILHVPAEIGQELVTKKQQRLYIEGGKKMDVHEGNLKHLRAAEQSYLWLAREFPKEHTLIECTKKGTILPPEKIHDVVWRVVEPLVKKT